MTIEWPSGSRGESRSAGSRTTVYRVARAVGSPPRELAFCFPSSASTAAGRSWHRGAPSVQRWYELPSAPLPSALWDLATRGTFEPLLSSGDFLGGSRAGWVGIQPPTPRRGLALAPPSGS